MKKILPAICFIFAVGFSGAVRGGDDLPKILLDTSVEQVHQLTSAARIPPINTSFDELIIPGHFVEYYALDKNSLLSVGYSEKTNRVTSLVLRFVPENPRTKNDIVEREINFISFQKDGYSVEFKFGEK